MEENIRRFLTTGTAVLMVVAALGLAFSGLGQLNRYQVEACSAVLRDPVTQTEPDAGVGIPSVSPDVVHLQEEGATLLLQEEAARQTRNTAWVDGVEAAPATGGP